MTLGGVGFFATGFALCWMYWWKHYPKFSWWLMAIGGMCMGAAAVGPLVRAGRVAAQGADQVSGVFGGGSAGTLLIAAICCVWAWMGIKKPGGGGNGGGGGRGHGGAGGGPKKSQQWAAFFAPVLVIGAGGLLSLATGLFAGGADGVSQLTAIIGGR